MSKLIDIFSETVTGAERSLASLRSITIDGDVELTAESAAEIEANLTMRFKGLEQVAALVRDTQDEDLESECIRLYRDKLHPFLLESRVLDWAFRQPLGYPGDFHAIRMVHRSLAQPNSSLGSLLTWYFMQTPIVKAVRDRTQYIGAELANLLRGKSSQRTRIMSIASGPALEYEVAFGHVPTSEIDADIVLLDQEPRAMAYAKSHLEPEQLVGPRGMQVQYREQSVQSYLTGCTIADDQKAGFDLIYSFGLFDYFDLKTSRLMIKSLMPLLRDGGKLMIANCSLEGHDHRYFMEYGLNWPLVYRDKSELEDLCSGIPAISSAHVEDVSDSLVKVLHAQR